MIDMLLVLKTILQKIMTKPMVFRKSVYKWFTYSCLCLFSSISKSNKLHTLNQENP